MWPAHRGAKYTRGRHRQRPAHRRLAILAGVAAAIGSAAVVPPGAPAVAGRSRSTGRSAPRAREFTGRVTPGDALAAQASESAGALGNGDGAAVRAGGAAGHAELWGFTAPWDPRSAASIKGHGASLDVIVSGWMRLDSLSAQPAMAYPDTVPSTRRLRRFALLTTYARDRFHPEVIRSLAADSGLRARVASSIAHLAVAGGYRGLVLDFESLAPADTGALSDVVRAIADSAHRLGVRPVVMAVPPADTLIYADRRLPSTDLLLVMLYDQHWSTGQPGPIASPEWVHQHLAPWIATAGPSRLVAALPVYGYLWRPPATATVLSFDDAQRQANGSGTTLARDSASGSLWFARPDSAQGWVSDAQQLRTLMRDAESAGVHRFALWRLGLEDPAIWSQER